MISTSDRPGLIGESACMLDLLDEASRVAPLDRPVLVVGERGTGKELVAARLHYLSGRWDQPFVAINCATLAESLLETELFGHEAGAFTGATRRRTGRFELADGGTLFLDELASASLRTQEKVLRVIEYGIFERVGASEPTRVDVRIVAATNADLPSEARAGRFREDLLDRLAFDVLTLPPLRERTGDVALLADHFGRAMALELGRSGFAGFGSAALSALERHRWPGNVRELRNVVERAVYRSEDGVPISAVEFDPFASPYRPAPAGREPAGDGREPAAAPEPDREPGIPTDLRGAVARFERRLVERALAAERHNQRAAARRLGLKYHQLRTLVRKHGLR